jgi:hypothetical protein
LQLAEENSSIQGYLNGVFWERNPMNKIKNAEKKVLVNKDDKGIFSNIKGERQ